MNEFIPIIVPLCIAVVSILFGYSISYRLNRKGLNEKIAAEYLQLIFYFSTPGLCIFVILSYYMPAQGKFWFFCWLFFAVILTMIWIIRARGKLKK